MLYTTKEQCTDWTSVWSAKSTAYDKQAEKEGAQTLPKRVKVKQLVQWGAKMIKCLTLLE
jgi:hypothetical protein